MSSLSVAFGGGGEWGVGSEKKCTKRWIIYRLLGVAMTTTTDSIVVYKIKVFCSTAQIRAPLAHGLSHVC